MRIKESPILESTTRTGKKKYWQGFVSQIVDKFYVQTSYWQDTADGQSKIQYSEPKYAEPTNVGRSNERSNKEQAFFELDALVKKQNDKGYFGEGVEAQELPLPMLANKWHDKKHTIQYPIILQPKLDGIRMLMQDGKCWSRMGKEIIPEVVQHIARHTNGLILDGELIWEGVSFQDTMRAIKKYNPETSPKLKYHVFDIVNTEKPFEDRYDMLEFWVDIYQPDNIVLVECIWDVVGENLLHACHGRYIQDGYEGTIIRTPDGMYQIGHRSSDLLKLKDFDDSEFTIIDVKDGEGRDAEAAIFICVASNQIFAVRPKGTMDYRREVWYNRASYIGKELTVRYQGVSEDGIPRFPVGISVRDKELQG
jgi:hypothetical protein